MEPGTLRSTHSLYVCSTKQLRLVCQASKRMHSTRTTLYFYAMRPITLGGTISKRRGGTNRRLTGTRYCHCGSDGNGHSPRWLKRQIQENFASTFIPERIHQLQTLAFRLTGRTGSPSSTITI